jgi:hypothetical protein
VSGWKSTTSLREVSWGMMPRRISLPSVGNATSRSIQDDKGDNPQVLIAMGILPFENRPILCYH